MLIECERNPLNGQGVTRENIEASELIDFLNSNDVESGWLNNAKIYGVPNSVVLLEPVIISRVSAKPDGFSLIDDIEFTHGIDGDMTATEAVMRAISHQEEL
jgi:hypothetical protein